MITPNFLIGFIEDFGDFNLVFFGMPPSFLNITKGLGFNASGSGKGSIAIEATPKNKDSEFSFV